MTAKLKAPKPRASLASLASVVRKTVDHIHELEPAIHASGRHMTAEHAFMLFAEELEKGNEPTES